MNQSRIASRPDQIAMQRGRRNREYDSVPFPLRILKTRRPRRFLIACLLRARRNCPRKIRTNRLPMQAAVGGLHHILCPQIKRGGIGRRKRQRRGPGPAILALMRRRVPRHRGPRADVLAEFCPLVEARHGPVTPAQINYVRIFRIDNHVTAFARARGSPIARRDLTVAGAARDRNRVAILLRAIHRVRKLVVGGHVIELRRRLVVPTAPGLAAVEADRGSLVRPENHARGICGIDPDLVIIVAARRAAHDRNCLPAIFRAVQSDIRHVDDIGVLRIDGDAAEIPGALGKPRIGIGQHPVVPAIVGTIESGTIDAGWFGRMSRCLHLWRGLHLDLRLRLGLRLNRNQRVHTLAVRSNRNAYASPIAIRQPVSD